MKNFQSRLRLSAAVLVGAAMLVLSAAVMADPPTRVARLSDFSGAVSFSPAGEDEWVLATANRPFVTGDRLWSDADARAELQAGSIALRLGASTSLNVLSLDDRTTQVELAQGSLYVRVWRFDRDEAVEIDTPNLAFTISSAGRYRIDVDADGNATTLAVLSGQGEAYGDGAAYRMSAGDRYSFSGTGLRDYEYSDIGPPDAFDRWAADRDRRYDTSISARYVSRDVIGYQDLDQYGTWNVVADYGNVWYPRSIPSGWAPYRTGHWAWIDPWGWTWIDDAPWGFAPYHYGRWAYVSGRWGWIPGPINVRPIYAPALVAFIGGGDLRLSVGGAASGIAWFPLGPGEVYEPAYRVSRDYFTNVNVSNTRITNVNITNVYNSYSTNTTITNVTYRNREAPGAVTAVPTTAFVQSQPVARSAVPVSREIVAQQPVSAVPRVAPTRASLVAAAATAASAAKPPARAMQREVVARTKPPAAPTPFAARQAALAANPGRPAEPATAAQGQAAPSTAVSARNVKVVAPTQAAAPPPKSADRRARGQPSDRAAGAAQGAAPGPQAAPSGQATGQAPRGAGAPQAPEAARRAGESGQRAGEVNKGEAAPAGAGQAATVPKPPQEQQRQQADQQRQQQQNQQAEQRRQQEQQRQQADQQRQQQQNQQAEQRRQQEQQRQQQQAQQAQQAEQRRQQEQQRQQQQSQQAEQRRQQAAPSAPPQPSAAQPGRAEPPREAPKRESKPDEKDQKDKDKKGSEG